MILVGFWAAGSAASAESFDPANCVAVSDQGLTAGAHRGTIPAAGVTDCLVLPTPAGARLDIWLPAYSTLDDVLDVDVVDADGTVLCHDWCDRLTGPTPYRILVSASKASDYQLTVQRTDQIAGCAELPQGAIGTTVGATATFSAARFGTCYAIPPDRHATSEIITAAPAGRSASSVWTAVYDSTGEGICGGYLESFDVAVAHCRLAAGQAYTVAVVGRPLDTSFRISRKDSSAAGADCRTPASTVVGGAPSADDVTAVDDVHCYRLTGGESDSFWTSVRDGTVEYAVFDAAGQQVADCSLMHPCRLTGSTEYRVFVWPASSTLPKSYLLDTWKLGRPGQTPAECPTVADPARQAPITGTLGGTSNAVCRTVPVDGGTKFQVRVTGTPYVYLFNHTGPSSQTAGYCRQDGVWSCALTGVRGDALLVISPRRTSADVPFRAEFDCDPAPCGTTPSPVTLTAVAPASAPNSGPVTLTLTGTGFTAGDTVRLTRTGSAAIPATVTGVSDDGTRLTAQANLTSVASGVWGVTAGSAGLANGLTVTAAPLKLVKAPAISGTVRVGATVRAVGAAWSPAAGALAYRWRADGVAIRGATGSTYAIPAALRGKRLSVTVTAKLANRADTAAASAAVAVGYGAAPAATKKPKITGTVKAGRTVKVSVGAWSPRADTYRYEWRLNGKVIKGATAASLKLKKSWAGKKLTVVVIAKRAGHYDGRAVAAAVKIKR